MTHNSLSRLLLSRVGIGFSGLLLLLVILSACDSPFSGTETPTPVAQFTVINLQLPPQALQAPIKGALPGNTPMHVGITFKINQQLLNQLGQHKAQANQNQNLENLANQLGISDSDYQAIKTFFNTNHVTLKLNKLHTYLAADGTAQDFAALFQTSFVLHHLGSRTFYTPVADNPPKLPTAIANLVVAVTGLDTYSTPPGPSIAAQPAQQVKSTRYPTADCNILSGSLFASQVAHAYSYDQLWRLGLHGEGMNVNLAWKEHVPSMLSPLFV